MKRNDSETEKCSLPAASWLGHSYKLPPIMQLYTKSNIHQLSVFMYLVAAVECVIICLIICHSVLLSERDDPGVRGGAAALVTSLLSPAAVPGFMSFIN